MPDVASSTGHGICTRCGADGPFTRQRQPWGLAGWCDFCWVWQRANAWRLYRAARRAGTVVPGDACTGCGRAGKLVGHHFDYRRPFAVRWLCPNCHTREHKVTGRCAGCGKTGQPKPLRTHLTECPAWLALPPDRQLGPEEEYRRWQADDREAERDEHRRDAIKATTSARAEAGKRFARSRDLDAVLDGIPLAGVTEDPVAQVKLLGQLREAGAGLLEGVPLESGEFRNSPGEEDQ